MFIPYAIEFIPKAEVLEQPQMEIVNSRPYTRAVRSSVLIVGFALRGFSSRWYD
jgi:hypothetical protein